MRAVLVRRGVCAQVLMGTHADHPGASSYIVDFPPEMCMLM